MDALMNFGHGIFGAAWPGVWTLLKIVLIVAPLMLGVGPLSGGYVHDGVAVITENELYAATARPRHRRSEARRANLEGWLRDLSELKIGDPVVHENHGIGRYLGLVHLDLGEGDTEFLHLEYAEGAKLYVPVANLQVISRYSGADPESVQLHTLGSGQWEKAKKKAADAAAKKLAAANLTLRQLTAKASAARALYLKAQQELNVATAAANAAAKHAAETALAVAEAHKTIGKMASSAYIMGGSFTDIQPLLSANGPQEIIDQLSTLNTLGARNTTALARFKAAEIVARAAKKKAEDILRDAGSEKDFLAYGKRVAAPGSGVRVEDLGYRTLDRLPQLFIDATQGVGSNQLVSRVLQSGAGFHVIKVIDRKGSVVANAQNIVVTQTQARHILLRHRNGVTDLEAQRRLNSFRDQIKVKAADFAQLAKKHSEDGSAPNGGNLGWMSPGELVPEFEQSMNQLNIGEVSDPVRTEFGWHLIQVVERRQAQLSADKQRDYARATLREKKLDQAYQDWIRQIRDAATVEIRSID